MKRNATLPTPRDVLDMLSHGVVPTSAEYFHALKIAASINDTTTHYALLQYNHKYQKNLPYAEFLIGTTYSWEYH